MASSSLTQMSHLESRDALKLSQCDRPTMCRAKIWFDLGSPKDCFQCITAIQVLGTSIESRRHNLRLPQAYSITEKVRYDTWKDSYQYRIIYMWSSSSVILHWENCLNCHQKLLVWERQPSIFRIHWDEGRIWPVSCWAVFLFVFLLFGHPTRDAGS